MNAPFSLLVAHNLKLSEHSDDLQTHLIKLITPDENTYIDHLKQDINIL